MDKKFLIVLVALVLSVTCTIGVTLAWLVSTPDPVTNTFTVGNIEITLDEAKVTAYGVKDGDSRVKANAYKLVPGQTYVKDPTVHVTANNEKCYVFVKVENGIAGFEATTNTIAKQIEDNEWTALDGYTGVYYKVVEANVTGDDAELVVFSQFVIADSVDKTALAGVNAETVVKVTAYAIQYASFETNPTEAWTTVNPAANG